MRACQQGYTGFSTFTSLLITPNPMTANNFDKMLSRLLIKDDFNDFAASAMICKLLCYVNSITACYIRRNRQFQCRQETGKCTLKGC